MNTKSLFVARSVFLKKFCSNINSSARALFPCSFLMTLLPPIESDHPFPQGYVLDMLMNNEEFRARLNFEMNDQEVIPGPNRNINYRPTISGIDSKRFTLKIFQNDKSNWIKDVILLTTRYLFNINGKTAKIKSVRKITPNQDGTSHSIVETSVKNDQLKRGLTQKFLLYISERHKTENSLLVSSVASEPASPNTFLIPFDHIFSEIQTTVSRLDQLLAQDLAVDESVQNVSHELEGFRDDILQASRDILDALDRRDALQNEIKEQSANVAEAAIQIKQILNDPAQSPTVPESKNDIAFVFSLIPLFAAIVGFYLKKK